MASLTLYNSLAGEKQVFTPIDDTHVRLYACGPTVYSYAHIGNARMAVVFDLLRSVLKTIYPRVTYVSNITDVDDKIMAAAAQTGEDIELFTRRYERIYNEDMAALGVAPPDIQPRATEHIGEMVALIEKLIARGNAYAAEGHVLFNVPSFPAYGTLSGRSRDDQIAGARVEISPFKKDPADFVLWKPSAEDQPGWDSPWGRGRPGWHIECSAMAERHLGLPFDIHGGGADLKFPHHENEIAQSCCAHGTNDASSFAKYWVHNGFVTVEGEKMSKSIGNIRLAHDLAAHTPGEALRLTLLSGHYRQPLDWSERAIAQSKATLDRLYRVVRDLSDVPDHSQQTGYEEVLEALCDDLNTPKALALLNRIAAKAAAERTPVLKAALVRSAGLLGLLRQPADQWLGYADAAGAAESGERAAIDALIAERNTARAARNFARADEIRRELGERGILIEDTAEGTVWRRS